MSNGLVAIDSTSDDKPLFSADSRAPPKTKSGFPRDERKHSSGRGWAVPFQEVQKNGNGKIQTNIRTNKSEQFEAATHENVGFRGKKGEKVHPNFATNIAMGFHCHTFCAPDP